MTLLKTNLHLNKITLTVFKKHLFVVAIINVTHLALVPKFVARYS